MVVDFVYDPTTPKIWTWHLPSDRGSFLLSKLDKSDKNLFEVKKLFTQLGLFPLFAPNNLLRYRPRQDIITDTTATWIQCPKKHKLVRFPTPTSAYTCDACGVSLAERTIVYGCDDCNWDMCHTCWKKELVPKDGDDDELHNPESKVQC